MKIFCKFPTINISKLNFWLVICIAKNFIWTTLKMIFSIFRFFCTLRFQIYKYCPIITNHTPMESYLFRRKLTLVTGFVLQGHMWYTQNCNIKAKVFGFEMCLWYFEVSCVRLFWTCVWSVNVCVFLRSDVSDSSSLLARALQTTVKQQSNPPHINDHHGSDSSARRACCK